MRTLQNFKAHVSLSSLIKRGGAICWTCRRVQLACSYRTQVSVSLMRTGNSVTHWILWVVAENYQNQGCCGSPQICNQLLRSMSGLGVPCSVAGIWNKGSFGEPLTYGIWANCRWHRILGQVELNCSTELLVSLLIQQEKIPTHIPKRNQGFPDPSLSWRLVWPRGLSFAQPAPMQGTSRL